MTRVSVNTGPVVRSEVPSIETARTQSKLAPTEVRRPDAPVTTSAERARVLDAALHALPPGVRGCAKETVLGDVLTLHADGVPLDPSSAAKLVFTLRSSALTRGDFIALRKHILSQVTPDRAQVHKTKAANMGCPQAEQIVTLLLAGSAANPKQPPVVSSLADARGALTDLLSKERSLVDEISKHGSDHNRLFDGSDLSAAERMAELTPRIVSQSAIVSSFADWAQERFGGEITRFRSEGRAVPPEDAGKLLYALRRHRASKSELSVLRDTLVEGHRDPPPSARVEPPTIESIFALMTGVDAKPTIAGLTKQIASTEGPRAAELEQVRAGLVNLPLDLLAAPIAALAETGRGVGAYHTAILAQTIDAMALEPPQLDRLQEALIAAVGEPSAKVRDAIRAADDTPSLMRVLTGEVLGRPPLPLDRAKLTDLIGETQHARADATEARLRLLDGRRPSSLSPDEGKALTKIDTKLASTSTRLDELKAVRAGVKIVRGDRWLDRLEVDVLAGGSVGVPGVFSGSAMGGVNVDQADPTTGRREKGIIGYAMPAFSVGGYGKLDLSYSRAEGFGVSGGGGADFLGVWGGPGGDSWGNVFAGGIWVPQVINGGIGYGVDDDEAYGAFILSTFWPPFSPASARVDLVVRHPGFAGGAERGAEMVRKLSESSFIQGGKDALATAASWIGNALEPVFDPVQDTAREMGLQVRGRRAASGLPSADVKTFLDALRTLSSPSDAAQEAAAGSPKALLDLHRADVRAVLPTLESLLADNPGHVESWFLLSSAQHALGDGPAAVDAAEKGWHAAQATDDPQDAEDARTAFIETAIAHGELDRVWPTLNDWLGESAGLAPRLLLVKWLGAQNRNVEAKQIAEGLAHTNPHSFPAQRALAAATGASPTAEVPT